MTHELTDEREAFEAWERNQLLNTPPRALAWAAWQARASLAHLAQRGTSEPVAWMCTRRLTGDKMVFSEPCVTGNPAYVKAHPHHDWKPLYHADALNPASDAALADGFDGSQVRPGPNHSTIEIWYDAEAQAIAAHKLIRDMIDAASPQAVQPMPDGGEASAIDRATVLRLAREASSGDGSELSGDAVERFAQLVFLEAASPSDGKTQEAPLQAKDTP